MTVATHPISIWEPRIHALSAVVPDLDWVHYVTRLGHFTASTDRDGEHILLLVDGIAARSDLPSSFIGPIVRAEVFRTTYRGTSFELRGMVLFDNRGTALLHAVHALMGYNGNGVHLTQSILEALGVSREQFDEANAKVSFSRYHVVFTREMTTLARGVKAAVPCTTPLKSWQYMIL